MILESTRPIVAHIALNEVRDWRQLGMSILDTIETPKQRNPCNPQRRRMGQRRAVLLLHFPRTPMSVFDFFAERLDLLLECNVVVAILI